MARRSHPPPAPPPRRSAAYARTSTSATSTAGMFPTAPARRHPSRWIPASPVKTRMSGPSAATHRSVWSGPASSLMWRMFGCAAASRRTSAGESPTPMYSGAFWSITGRSTASAIAPKYGSSSSAARFEVIGGGITIPAAPHACACRASATAWWVDSAPTPTRTGTRPSTSATIASHRRRRSPGVSLFTSAPIPKQTTPSAPQRSAKRTTARWPSRSSDPSSANGVASTGKMPANPGWSVIA